MSFTQSLNVAINKRKEDARKIFAGAALGVSSRIIKRTPVGNPSLWKGNPPKGYVGGSLRGAWVASVGSPNLTERTPPDASGARVTARAVNVTQKIKLGEVFYLTNNLPYAHRVEFGWSKQAPAGMLRVSVKEARRLVKRL